MAAPGELRCGFVIKTRVSELRKSRLKAKGRVGREETVWDVET